MPAPIDLDHLDKYVLGDRALLDEILSIFIEQAAMLVARLEAAADDESWRAAAHTIKGAARGVGSWALGDLAEEAEAILGPDARRRPAALQRIRAAADTAILYAKTLRERAA